MSSDNGYYLNSLIGGKTPFRQTYLADNQPGVLTPEYIIKKIVPHPHPPRSFEEAKHLFRQEADRLYKLGKHPQIPAQLDEFDRDGVFYLVYERIYGESLAHELKDGKPWNEARVIVLIQEILEILKFFHTVGGPHLDINPHSFIRRRSDGKLVLIDFGAVRCHELSPMQWGTPGYMPPDTARETPGFHSDIYAVGSIAIQALTGVQPTQLQEGNSSFRWRNLAQVSDSLAATLDKMVNPYFRNRYDSVDEVLRDLKKNQLFSQFFRHLNLSQLSVYLKLPPKFLSIVAILFLVALSTPIFTRAYRNLQAYLLIQRGNEFNHLQDYDQAISAAEQALKYRSDFVAQAMLLKAYAMGQKNSQNTQERYKLCSAAEALRENYAAAWNCLGNIAFLQGQFELAIDYFDQVIQVYKDPNNPWYNEPREEIWAVWNKADILVKQTKYSDAHGLLTEFLNNKQGNIPGDLREQTNRKIKEIEALMP
ncbi:protein kinase domain-containing protein [Oscillatoria acuminata]|uniref:non-specific serine/threonine protein kinase n=1 Tax=Oscillatoria acuminata PCC 6304 TaxID=56110 RepID=K9TN24_9CYAN|nr:tetratricopeptide repeat protein [Oscillatoria acuminata]AFY83419.1 serine/threonine protein kinase [Oscillatoria acuminata PCC 6304]